MSTSSPPLLLHQLHPVEQFLALLIISAAALHRLFSHPPRVIRQRPTMDELAANLMARVETAFGITPATGSPVVVLPTKAMAMAYGRSILDPVRKTMIEMGEPAHLASLTIRELQQMARERGMRSVDGRPLKYCKKARLVEVLSNG